MAKISDAAYENKIVVDNPAARRAILQSLLEPLRPVVHGARRPVAIVNEDRGLDRIAVLADDRGGGTGGARLFRTSSDVIWGEYSEDWLKDRGTSAWRLQQANLHLYRVYDPKSRTQDQILALHCEPKELGQSDHSKLKQGPHIHVCAGGNILSHSHIPLNYCHLDSALRSTDDFMSVWKAAIRVVQIEVIESRHLDN